MNTLRILKFRFRIRFNWHDIWVGLFIREAYRTHTFPGWYFEAYICILPMFPMRLIVENLPYSRSTED